MARDSSADSEAQLTASFTVGRWRVDPTTDTLLLEGRTVKLEPRTMRLLIALAERPGAVRSIQMLLDTVWPGIVVTPHSLYQAVGELRSVLRDDTDTAEFIANVPRKGYRLVAPVSSSAAAPLVGTAVGNAGAERSSSLTIAVLPFHDLGLPSEISFLPETVLAELALELSRQPGLVTIARGTMLYYRNHSASPRRIAAELKARYVVDGSITLRGDQLSVACELIDAANDLVLASESIDMPVAEWPQMSQRVVGRLARALRLEVSEHAVRSVDMSVPERATAMQLAMRAWVELYCRPQSRETNDRAWGWAAEALRRDASIGVAWNAVAYCEWRAAQYVWHPRGWAELIADAVTHAQRAAVLSPNDPDAHYVLGLACHTSGEGARAEATVRHCLQISASYAPAYSLLALVRTTLGHPEEAFALCERAFALSPREPLRAVWHWSQSCAASMLGRDEQALDFAMQGIAANPDYPACYLIAAASAYRLGRHDEAARHVKVLRRSAFSTTEVLRKRLPPMRAEPWASGFIADLQAAGLPER